MLLPPLKWIPSPNYSSRGGVHIDILVLHDTEGSYQSAISWFAMKQSQVSAHFVVREDGLEATQMVDISQKAWHVCNVNPRSIGFEMAGISKKGFGAQEIQALADIFAYHLHAMDIPCARSQRGRTPGICSHYETGPLGGGHSDPSIDPKWMDHFFELTQASYNNNAFPILWPSERELGKCSLRPI